MHFHNWLAGLVILLAVPATTGCQNDTPPSNDIVQYAFPKTVKSEEELTRDRLLAAVLGDQFVSTSYLTPLKNSEVSERETESRTNTAKRFTDFLFIEIDWENIRSEPAIELETFANNTHFQDAMSSLLHWHGSNVASCFELDVLLSLVVIQSEQLNLSPEQVARIQALCLKSNIDSTAFFHALAHDANPSEVRRLALELDEDFRSKLLQEANPPFSIWSQARHVRTFRQKSLPAHFEKPAATSGN